MLIGTSVTTGDTIFRSQGQRSRSVDHANFRHRWLEAW